jgi:esterase/lipase superfamily enzyme
LNLAILALFILISASASAQQPTSSPFQSEFTACSQPLTFQEQRALESKKVTAQRNITQLQRKARQSEPGDSGLRESLESQIRQSQIDLVQTMERLECAQLSKAQDLVLRGPGTAPPNFVELRIYYATDRTVTQGSTDPEKHFTGTLDSSFIDFSYGVARVTIPTQRKPGELNLPGYWSFVSKPDPTRYFVIRDLTDLSRDALMKQLTDGSGRPSLLLFVHGFNVSFSDAAFRTAQLAHDLQFPGKAMFYSWPSAGTVTRYWEDEDSSRISTPRFQKLLAGLLKQNFSHVYILAHSMGSRIVISSINNLASQGVDVSKISELILAAPDFNEIEFKDIASAFRDLRTKGTHVTIYASSNDFALRVSRVIHSYRRLGQSDPSPDIFPGLDSIDASMIAPMRRAFGHSYVCDNAQVIGDMEDIILHGLPPHDRGLLTIPQTSGGWSFPK